MSVTTVRLDELLEQKLDQLAKKTHRSKSFYIKKALQEFMDDQEDYQLALAAYESRGKLYSIEEVRKMLDVED